jgi:hypothetical protein
MPRLSELVTELLEPYVSEWNIGVLAQNNPFAQTLYLAVRGQLNEGHADRETLISVKSFLNSVVRRYALANFAPTSEIFGDIDRVVDRINTHLGEPRQIDEDPIGW